MFALLWPLISSYGHNKVFKKRMIVDTLLLMCNLLHANLYMSMKNTPIEAWKCKNLLSILNIQLVTSIFAFTKDIHACLGNYYRPTDQPTDQQIDRDQPTNRRSWLFIRKLHCKKSVERAGQNELLLFSILVRKG